LGRTCVPSAIHHQGENLGALNILRTASRCPILRRFSPYARASPSLRQGIDPRPSIPATRCWIIGTKRPPHTKAVVSILGSLIVSPSLPFLCGIPLGPVRSLIFWNPDLAFVHRFLPTLSLLSVFSSPLCFLCLSVSSPPLCWEGCALSFAKLSRRQPCAVCGCVPSSRPGRHHYGCRATLPRTKVLVKGPRRYIIQRPAGHLDSPLDSKEFPFPNIEPPPNGELRLQDVRLPTLRRVPLRLPSIGAAGTVTEGSREDFVLCWPGPQSRTRRYRCRPASTTWLPAREASLSPAANAAHRPTMLSTAALAPRARRP
jgi:hypothetical protein